MKKWLGRIMLPVPLVAYFVLMATEAGIERTIIALAIVLAGFGWIIIAVWLMDS